MQRETRHDGFPCSPMGVRDVAFELSLIAALVVSWSAPEEARAALGTAQPRPAAARPGDVRRDAHGSGDRGAARMVKRRPCDPRRASASSRSARVRREHSDATVLFHATIAGLLGLSPTDYRVMGLVERLGPLSAGEIARHSGLATASVTNLIRPPGGERAARAMPKIGAASSSSSCETGSRRAARCSVRRSNRYPGCSRATPIGSSR